MPSSSSSFVVVAAAETVVVVVVVEAVVVVVVAHDVLHDGPFLLDVDLFLLDIFFFLLLFSLLFLCDEDHLPILFVYLPLEKPS